MGIYDRDYERSDLYSDSPGLHLGRTRTLTTNLVIGMGVVYGVQLLTQPAQPSYPAEAGWFTSAFSLHADVLKRPWMCFELLTYGFLHDPGDLRHILFNMIALWFFGRPVEGRYGRREYLAFFLLAVVVAGLAWILSEWIASGAGVRGSMLGASGGIAAVLLLFALNFPRQLVYIWGVFPLPAWAFAILFVLLDLYGAVHREGAIVAYTAHLGGAAFALLYFQFDWPLSRWLPTGWSLARWGGRPKLRIIDPSDQEDDSTDTEVDEILRKIQQYGQDSLTRRERRILEQASREYQKKRR